jgi:hypothetical protein
MMAEANSAAEMAIEKAAANRLWLVVVIMVHFLPLYLSASPSCRLPEGLQELCQNRESAENRAFAAVGACCAGWELRRVGEISQLVGSAFLTLRSGAALPIARYFGL